jgi:hypothetical protein
MYVSDIFIPRQAGVSGGSATAATWDEAKTFMIHRLREKPPMRGLK